jgi:hypothetical protein
MSNKSPHTILATARVYARPPARPITPEIESFLQGCYVGLTVAPKKWRIILKTAFDYACDYHPDPSKSGVWWFRAFHYSVDEQLAGINLDFWGKSYPQVEGALVQGHCGDIIAA